MNATTRKPKVKQETHSKCCQRQGSMGHLKPKKLKLKGDLRTLKGMLRSCTSTVFKHFFQDNTKAPMGNAAEPAMFSHPSLDVYLAVNDAKGSINETVMHSACGVCSGTSSIGLNPRDFCNNTHTAVGWRSIRVCAT